MRAASSAWCSAFVALVFAVVRAWLRARVAAPLLAAALRLVAAAFRSVAFAAAVARRLVAAAFCVGALVVAMRKISPCGTRGKDITSKLLGTV